MAKLQTHIVGSTGWSAPTLSLFSARSTALFSPNNGVKAPNSALCKEGFSTDLCIRKSEKQVLLMYK